MRSETVIDRLFQIVGLLLLAGLTALLVFAFHKKLLPAQGDGDVFGTVYAMTSDSDASETEDE